MYSFISALPFLSRAHGMSVPLVYGIECDQRLYTCSRILYSFGFCAEYSQKRFKRDAQPLRCAATVSHLPHLYLLSLSKYRIVKLGGMVSSHTGLVWYKCRTEWMIIQREGINGMFSLLSSCSHLSTWESIYRPGCFWLTTWVCELGTYFKSNLMSM